MATLLPSIIEMQRHISSEVELIRQNMHRLEDSMGRLASESATKALVQVSLTEPSVINHNPDASLHAAVAKCVNDTRSSDMKFEQVVAQLQFENARNTHLFQDISSKNEEARRDEQLRSDMSNQKIQDTCTKVDGVYAVSHGDHIRIDVLNTNIQDIVRKIATIEKHLASIDLLTSNFGAHQTVVNGRLDLLEKAAQPGT
jgi:hypothetical protein